VTHALSKTVSFVHLDLCRSQIDNRLTVTELRLLDASVYSFYHKFNDIGSVVYILLDYWLRLIEIVPIFVSYIHQ